MPYQNLDSEIMLALVIWLLAISIFVIMLLLALLEILAENRAKTQLHPKTEPNRWEYLRHIAGSLFKRKR